LKYRGTSLDRKEAIHKEKGHMSVALTEAAWKTVATKFKIKDNGLGKALSDYQKIPTDGAPKVGNDKYLEFSDKRIKALKEVQRLDGALSKAKEVAANKDVGKYLKDLDTACVAEEQATSKQVAEVQDRVKKEKDDDAALEKAMKNPDSKMLKIVFDIGYDDGYKGERNVSGLFAKSPPLLSKYVEGYNRGKKAADDDCKVGGSGGAAIDLSKVGQNQGPSMRSISKEEMERAKEYDRQRAARKEFIKYLNDQWGFVLPEDM
jgi:hypothetical protein